MTISMHEHVHERNKKRKNTQNRKKNNLERNPHQQNKELLGELNPKWDE